MFEPNCVLIKVSPEIHIKSDFVKKFFLKKLREHIKFSLKQNGIEVLQIVSERGRLAVFCANLEKAMVVLRKVFGIQSIALAQKINESDFEKILQNSIECIDAGFFNEGDTFAVRASVFGKKEFNSRNVEEKLGEKILQKFPFLKVSLKNPKKEVFAELKQKDFYVFFENFGGLNGLPAGVEGNIGLLYCGKKECLISCFLMLKRGCNVFPIIEKSNPDFEKAFEKLKKFNCFRDFVLTEKKDLENLLKSKDVIALADCEANPENVLQKSKKFKGVFSIPVFFPMAFFPKSEIERIWKLIEETAD